MPRCPSAATGSRPLRELLAEELLARQREGSWVNPAHAIREDDPITATSFALIALGMLSIRFGYDSRSGPRSKEEELAAYGMSWEDLRPRHLPTSEPQAALLPTLREDLPRAA